MFSFPSILLFKVILGDQVAAPNLQSLHRIYDFCHAFVSHSIAIFSLSLFAFMDFEQKTLFASIINISHNWIFFHIWTPPDPFDYHRDQTK